ICPIEIDVVSQLFSVKEIEDLNLKLPIEKDDYFYDLWTLKESYVKAIGKGLSIPLNSFTIKKSEEGITIDPNNIYSPYFLKQYQIDPDYK
ncbi:4'-phosphopantetheinyl transferase family protein, partial [Bacillus pseudomycoides]